MHGQQVDFINEALNTFPNFRSNVKVLDVGSADINGNNRQFFINNYQYTGIDIAPAPNVDVITPIHLYKSDFLYDVVLTGEMLEHDKYWKDSIRKMISLVRIGGIFIMTCASTGRPEHGTTQAHSGSSPHTNDYYRNISATDFEAIVNIHEEFGPYSLRYQNCDLFFYGIRIK
jgi:hypothetical protein